MAIQYQSHYLSTAEMPFTSAYGAATSESFQAAIDADEVLPDGLRFLTIASIFDLI